MKKLAVFALFLGFIGVNVLLIPAQARRVPTNDSGKANKRPAQTSPTPAPTPTPEDENTTNIEPIAVSEPLSEDDIIKVDTSIVTIPVKVLDRKNRFISGLNKEDFKVWEDNVEQQIELFSNEEQPFTVALVLDMSFSAKFKAEEIQAAAISFISQLRPNDKVMVVSFDEEVHLLTEATNDRDRIYRAIKSTKIDFGTSVYEAMDLVINDRFRKMDGRKAIVLFSDGVDTSSRRAHDMNNLSDALELDALIYPIRYDTFSDVQAMKNKPVSSGQKLPGQIPSKTKSPLPFPIPTQTVGMMGDKGTTPEEYKKADEYLDQLAFRTGGRMFYASTTGNLTKAFADIAAELREFYSIGYYPKDEAEKGKKRKIKVKVNRENVAVKARDNYVIGKKDN
ncbi:MAG: VWA domain-containing protein [Pyrinomonadaceae bacterium]|nr:VWA domain-containing protein [Pyrinomonadaceae bacterium]